MILENLPIKIRGTIKGISPEQAKHIFNYNLPPDAKGLTFRIINKRNIISPYYPEKYSNQSPKSRIFRSNTKNFCNLNKIASQISKTIIYPIWTPIADKQKYYSGYHMFISTNCRRMDKGTENLLFTIGDLPLPQPSVIEHKNSTLKLFLRNYFPEYQVGIISIDSKTLQIEHISLENCSKFITLSVILKNPKIFLYYKSNKNYSPSVRVLPIT